MVDKLIKNSFSFEKKIPQDLESFFFNKKKISKTFFSKTKVEANIKLKKADEIIDKVFSDIRGQKSFSTNIDYLSNFSDDLVNKNLKFMDRKTKILNVCLIKIPTFEAPQSFSYFNSVPSLGLAYIAGSIRNAGHKLQVIDAPGDAISKYNRFKTEFSDLLAHGLDKNEIVERINPDTDVVGITNMFLHEWEFIRDFLKVLKQKHPNVTVVMGGETASAWWEHMFKNCPELDICVLGEGEEAMIDILEKISNGKHIKNCSSIAYRENNKILKTTRMARIKDINNIPLPAWDLFPIDNYLKYEFGSGVNRGRSIPMLSSRGCPFQCTFCSSPEMWTTRYYARDPKLVADEIEYYQKRYDVTNVNFNDLTAVLTKKWIVEFCNVILDRNINFSWQLPSGTRSEAVDFEAAKLLYKSGCRNFGYAPESGSPEILTKIKKKVKIDSLIESLKSSLKANLKTHANIIIGFPEEKFLDLIRTYKLIIKMAFAGLHGISVMMFSPYPGSAYYRELKEKNKIKVDSTYIYSSLDRSGASVRGYNNNFSTRFIIVTQWFFLLSFFSLSYLIRPQRFLAHIKNFLKKNQETIMDQFLAEKFKQFKRKLALKSN
tara:strand:- start:451 stop:2259 length:1809 start_codon:yes stop_codon:yes gene_type:complete